MKVKYLGSDISQRNWGSYTGDFDSLVVGGIYEIEREEVHSWHTKVFLKGIEGSFNSVCFEEVAPNGE